MFSGIIESLGTVEEISPVGSGLRFRIGSSMAPYLTVDQSVAHNGVCLTVEAVDEYGYIVTAVEETLRKTALGSLAAGDTVNLERSLQLSARLDGHIVQGHVDTTGICTGREELEGSHLFHFSYPKSFMHLLVEKGSIAINGVSLTAFNCQQDSFSVTIIPYTLVHTTFNHLQPGNVVNLEFDILGKYFARWMQSYRQ